MLSRTRHTAVESKCAKQAKESPRIESGRTGLLSVGRLLCEPMAAWSVAPHRRLSRVATYAGIPEEQAERLTTKLLHDWPKAYLSGPCNRWPREGDSAL